MKTTENELQKSNKISSSKWLGFFALFLLFNFGALGIGMLLHGEGPGSMWYSSLNKAPWTPPGWVFGAAWFSIMLCFSIYLANLSQKINFSAYLPLFLLQWILNVSWNPLFFNKHLIGLALLDILLLTFLVVFISLRFRKNLGKSSWLIAPYVVWLCIAVSLNAYVFLEN